MPTRNHSAVPEVNDLDGISPESRSELEDDYTSAEEDEEPWTSSCICGQRTPPLSVTGDPSPSIMCDVCSGSIQHWQHNVCMGLPLFEEDIPEIYACHVYDAEDMALRAEQGEARRGKPISGWHEETRRSLDRGERIWERRVEIWRREGGVRSGVRGVVEVLGDPGESRVSGRRKKVRIWVRPKGEVVREKSVKGTAKIPGKKMPSAASNGEAKKRPAAQAKMPAKMAKTTMRAKQVNESEKQERKQPKTKAKHQDGKPY
ncbi:hypothetical protein DOTSEDRAFT_27541 [Dothistroma septosporum NZE10]|uniref:Zinc finger PHD-type domain-containing protein n=1 Tax=Dothistroma septosporum (strain NZE10 / CBS 128990) TaxID=675120 RepID=N1PHB5_DOTSN|nr:hypothetical protein DOTSEDRAFT_27541 [Dothistroma septosporum NZE10]